MPTLHWVGKDKVVNHHHEVPFRVLNKVSSFRAPEGLPTNTTDNRIIHGDNLEALKSLLPEFEGQVKCIYIDPPYNTGNEGWVYNDAVNDPKIKRWLGQVVGKEGEDLSRHGFVAQSTPLLRYQATWQPRTRQLTCGREHLLPLEQARAGALQDHQLGAVQRRAQAPRLAAGVD